MSTRAVLLARLVERVQEKDEAYLVFEKLRTLRGRDSRGLLVFSHPTVRLPGPPAGRRFTREHLDELQKGRLFLLPLVKGGFSTPEWIPLDGLDEASIASHMKPYEELDRDLKLDPWDAVRGTDFARGCARMYYRYRASGDEINLLLKTYVKRGATSPEDDGLAHLALERAEETHHGVPFIVLEAIWKMGEVENGWAALRRSKVRGKALQLLAQAEDRRFDRYYVEATDSPDDNTRAAALKALSLRRIPEAEPGILRALEGIPSEGTGGWDRHRAAKALIHHKGAEAVGQILAFCNRDREDLVKNLDALLPIIDGYVDHRHMQVLRSFGDLMTRDRSAPRSFDDLLAINNRVRIVELLIDAGDPDAPGELEPHVTGSLSQTLPYVQDERLLRHAKAWAPIARRMLDLRLCADGACFMSAAAVLLHEKDPALGDLLLPYVAEGDWFRPWALRYLAMVAEEKHRNVLEKHATSKKGGLHLYAYAGLARLGDNDALVKVIKSPTLAPDGTARYVARKYVVPTFDFPSLVRLWEKHSPPAEDRIGRAVHAFVLDGLTAICKKH